MTKLNDLEAVLKGTGALAVAVSGGVDSMTLAFVAHRVNNECQMYHALSPAVPVQATDRVKHYAELEGWNLNLIDAGEIHDPDYISNPVNRCYYCKTNLYDTVCESTGLVVASGTNLDDLGDYRPGLIAAQEHKVHHPYVEAAIAKADIRNIAKSLDLIDLQDLPAAPCLSSRVLTGIAIDENLLPVINEAEEALWESLLLFLPLKGVRCRIRHNEVAIEIETNEMVDPTAEYAREARSIVSATFEKYGYKRYLQTISVEPYQRGSAFLHDTLITSSN
jgi:pyridinium-3,5-biscarboxylic acid mononucleotide sulfurtransferase